MHVELTCCAELAANTDYDELIADYNLHPAPSHPGMKGSYLSGAQSRENYRNLEKMGMLTIFRAMHEGRMVGIISILDVSQGVMVMVESLYVIDRFRSTGAGNALLVHAKAFCKARNNKAIIIGTVPGGVIDRKLTRDKRPVISKLFYIEL